MDHSIPSIAVSKGKSSTGLNLLLYSFVHTHQNGKTNRTVNNQTKLCVLGRFSSVNNTYALFYDNSVPPTSLEEISFNPLRDK